MPKLGRPIDVAHGHLKDAIIDAETDGPASFGGAGAEVVVFRQADDPGAVGPGMLWIDTSSDDPTTIRIRDADDADWLPLIAVYADGTIGFERDSFGLALSGTDLSLTSPGPIHVTGFSGGSGDSGGSAVLTGGDGDDGDTSGASVTAGAGSEVADGRVSIRTADQRGHVGQVLVSGSAALDSSNGAVWGGVGGGDAPGGLPAAGTLPIFLATNPKGLHVWDGDSWVAIKAAHVADGASVDDLRDALVAAGLMEGS